MTRKVDYKSWVVDAQEGELKFHETCVPRRDGSFMEDSSKLLKSLGFSNNDLEGKKVLDAGAGSVLRTRFFKNIYLVAVDPLATLYSKIPWSDISYADEVYNLPLEARIDVLSGEIDYIFSMNVLDHCFDFDLCIHNLAEYLRNGGEMFLSFDEHDNVDALHPLSLHSRECEDVFSAEGLNVIKFSEGPVYGVGERSLNYWLKKG